MQRSIVKSLISLLFLSIICFFFIFVFLPSASERYFGVSFRGTEEKQIEKEADGLVEETRGMDRAEVDEYLKDLDAEDLRAIGNFAKENAGVLAALLKNDEIRGVVADAIKGGSEDVQAVLKEFVH